MQTISIVRQRGQITIPQSIRSKIGWVSPTSAISIMLKTPSEIVITPHRPQVNWEEMWRLMQQSRMISGKGKQSAAEFLESDRNSH